MQLDLGKRATIIKSLILMFLISVTLVFFTVEFLTETNESMAASIIYQVMLGTILVVPLLLAILVDANRKTYQFIVVTIGVSAMITRYLLIYLRIGTLSGTDVLAEWGLARTTVESGHWYPEIGSYFSNLSGFPGVIMFLVTSSSVAHISLSLYPTLQIIISSAAVVGMVFLFVRELVGPRLALISLVIAAEDNVFFFSAPGVIRESLTISAFLMILFLVTRASAGNGIMRVRTGTLILLASTFIVITHDFSTVIFIALIFLMLIAMSLSFNLELHRLRDGEAKLGIRKFHNDFARRLFFPLSTLLILLFVWIGYVSGFVFGMWVDRLYSVISPDSSQVALWGAANQQILYSGSDWIDVTLRLGYRFLILAGFLLMFFKKGWPADFLPKRVSVVEVVVLWGGIALSSVVMLSLLPLGPLYSLTRLVKFDLVFYALFVAFTSYAAIQAMKSKRIRKRIGSAMSLSFYLIVVTIVAIPPVYTTLDSMSINGRGQVNINRTPGSYTPRDVVFVETISGIIPGMPVDVYFERESGAMYFFLMGHSSWLYKEIGADFFLKDLSRLLVDGNDTLIVFRQDPTDSREFIDSTLTVRHLTDAEVLMLGQCDLLATDGSSMMMRA